MLRPFFSADFERNVQNLSDYLYQRCGGPSYYSDRQGIPNLAQRHEELSFDHVAVERWLHHMENSLDEAVMDFNEDQRQQLLDFMRYTAYFMLVWSSKHRQQIAMGGLF